MSQKDPVPSIRHVERERERESCIHPKLCNINLHNITHFLISGDPRERMFVVQISLLIVSFLFFISWNLSLMQTTEKSTHTLVLCHVSICGGSPPSSSSSSYATCCVLMHAHVTSPGKAKWGGPDQRR